MKTVILLAVCVILQLTVSANDTLRGEKCVLILTKGKIQAPVKFWSLENNTLQVEKNGSLHDIPLLDVLFVDLRSAYYAKTIDGNWVLLHYDTLITYQRDTLKGVFIFEDKHGATFHIMDQGKPTFIPSYNILKASWERTVHTIPFTVNPTPDVPGKNIDQDSSSVLHNVKAPEDYVGTRTTQPNATVPTGKKKNDVVGPMIGVCCGIGLLGLVINGVMNYNYK